MHPCRRIFSQRPIQWSILMFGCAIAVAAEVPSESPVTYLIKTSVYSLEEALAYSNRDETSKQTTTPAWTMEKSAADGGNQDQTVVFPSAANPTIWIKQTSFDRVEWADLGKPPVAFDRQGGRLVLDVIAQPQILVTAGQPPGMIEISSLPKYLEEDGAGHYRLVECKEQDLQDRIGFRFEYRISEQTSGKSGGLSVNVRAVWRRVVARKPLPGPAYTIAAGKPTIATRELIRTVDIKPGQTCFGLVDMSDASPTSDPLFMAVDIKRMTNEELDQLSKKAEALGLGHKK